MQGYTKHFTDGKTELVTDELVKASKASWSRGQLSDMSAVDLHMNGLLLTLSTPGDYWVADDYIALVRTPRPGQSITVPSQFVARRIQRQITNDDVNKWVIFQIRNEKLFHMYLALKPGDDAQYQITKEHVGQWLTLEYAIPEVKISYRLSNNKG